MNAAEITALCTGIPTVLAAIAALFQATKAKAASNTAASHAATVRGLIESQVYSVNKPQSFPAPPADEPK